MSVISSLKIFLSSPGDVSQERGIARTIVDQLRYDPFIRGKVNFEIVAWDQPGAGTPMLATMTPQEAVNQGLPKPSQCDIVVVILWSRIGTPLPHPEYQKPDGTQYQSGTEWEYYDALTAAQQTGKPLLVVYRRTDDLLMNPRDKDFLEKYEQWNRVEAFFRDFTNPDGSLRQGFNTYQKPEDFRREFENHLKKLVQRLVKDTPIAAPSLPTTWEGSPFPGLRAFTQKDAPIFFGRGREVDALIEKMATSRFVGVVGASGSGKSSLVGAGLLPRLQENAISGAEISSQYWLPVIIRPGADPFQALAAGMLTQLPGQTTDVSDYPARRDKLAKSLLDRPRDLSELCWFVLKEQPQWAEILFFIDQFEELFTVADSSLVEPFVRLLSGIADSGRIRTVITLRADFYHRCVELPALAALFDLGQYPLSVPGLPALFEMITRPADRAALRFDEGLPQRILEDTGNDPGALALMAYALDELYHACKGESTLSNTAYEALGGVKGAIGKRAENTFKTLDDDAKQQLMNVFRELIEVDERGTVTRRRAHYREVMKSPAAEALVNALTSARLLVRAQQDGQPVVEIAHEALMQNWTRLSDWIESVQDKLFLLRQVRNAASEWNRYGRRPDYLWSHERLQPIYQIRDELRLELEPVIEAFIRPEAERLLEEYQNETTKSLRKQSIIDRMIELGASSIPSLISIMMTEPAYSNNLDQVYEGLQRFPETVLPALLAMLAPDAPNATDDSRARAAHALGLISDPRAVPDLIRALETPDASPYVMTSPQVTAAEALGKIGDAAAVPALIHAAGSAESGNTRAAAISALAVFGDRSAIPTLINALDDPDYAARGNAVDALSTFRDSELAPTIAKNLRDESSDVRVRVIASLAKIGDKSIVPALIDVLANDPDPSEYDNVRGKAADVLGILGDVTVTPVLEHALHDRRGEVRYRALLAMTRVANAEIIPSVIEIAQNGDNSDQRKAAIQVLTVVGYGSAAASDCLRKLLADPDDTIRAAATESLIEIGDAGCVPDLIRCLYDKEYMPANIATQGLKVLAGVDAVPALLEVAVDINNNEWARSSAAEVLRNFRDVSLVDAVSAYCDDQNETVASAAEGILFDVVRNQDVATLISLLAHRHASVRAAAVSTLSEKDDPQVCTALRPLLDDPHASVRAAAANAVGICRDEQAITALAALVGDDDKDVRAAAIGALAEFGGSDTVSALIDRLNDPELDVQLAAVRALRAKGDTRAIAPLRALLSDDSEEKIDFREAVLETLLDLYDENSVPDVLEMLDATLTEDDPSPEVVTQRVAFVESLRRLDDPTLVIRLFQFLDEDTTEQKILAAAESLRQAAPPELLARALIALIPEYEPQTDQLLQLGSDVLADLLLLQRSNLPNDTYRAAIERLRGEGIEVALRACVQKLRAEEPQEQQQTLDRIRDLLTPEYAHLITPLLEVGPVELRMDIAGLLADIGDYSGVPLVMTYLTSEEWGSRDRAFAIASTINLPEVKARLFELINHENYWFASLAIDKVTEDLDGSLNDRLLKTLRKGEVLSAGAAMKAIVRFHVTEALPDLIHLSKLTESGSVGKSDAIDALAELGGVEVVPELIRALRDPESEVRFHAARALEKIGSAEAQQALATKQTLLKYLQYVAS